MAQLVRQAHPYRDLDVIDARAPRVDQAVVGTISLLAVVFGWPLAWATLATQLLIGLSFGRQYCLPCLLYSELIQPRFGEGRLEDARAPRFANMIGLTFLTAAATAWWLGASATATVLGAIVAALALLATTTGFCLGCKMYWLLARWRLMRYRLTS